MSTPEEEDILRKEAIKQIVEQMQKEYAEKNELPPSYSVLWRKASSIHDAKKSLT